VSGLPWTPKNSHKANKSESIDCTMASVDEEDWFVWVELVIDGDDSYEPLRIKIIPQTKFVHDLKKTVAEEYTFLLTSLGIDAASLRVYTLGTDDGTKSLSPTLPLSKTDFPIETTLIVTAKSRQQHQATVVRCHTHERLCILYFSSLASRIQSSWCRYIFSSRRHCKQIRRI
jgi:hypothetical protein